MPATLSQIRSSLNAYQLAEERVAAELALEAEVALERNGTVTSSRRERGMTYEWSQPITNAAAEALDTAELFELVMKYMQTSEGATLRRMVAKKVGENNAAGVLEARTQWSDE